MNVLLPRHAPRHLQLIPQNPVIPNLASGLHALGPHTVNWDFRLGGTDSTSLGAAALAANFLRNMAQ